LIFYHICSPKYRREALMSEIEIDEVRENRIDNEIITDAYDEQERALSWYYYLVENLKFPFRARCYAKRIISPLDVGEEVIVEGMAPEDDCHHDMLVVIHWKERFFAIPLYQLKNLNDDYKTNLAMTDWLYWLARGYEF